VLALAAGAFANHGPGTSGGGSATISGETLKAGTFDVSLRIDGTWFENVSRAEAEQRASKSGEFDALDRSFLYSIGLAHGVTDDFQIGATIGYYTGFNFIDAESDGTNTESSTADPKGITDLVVTGKYRFLQGPEGNLSAIAGVSFPTGRDNEKLDNGERLEPSSQPGTGAFGFPFGLAYSRFLTTNLTMDASALYTARLTHNEFKVGDRFDAGIAAAYRLNESIKDFPQYSVFTEFNMVWLGKDEQNEVHNPNSGGTTIYVTPGTRVRFNDAIALTLAVSVPISQNLNGDQIESRLKAAATLSWSF
jgi:hypothetical protein